MCVMEVKAIIPFSIAVSHTDALAAPSSMLEVLLFCQRSVLVAGRELWQHMPVFGVQGCLAQKV